ncbi:hypothetical protein Asp14428_22140 [Actinoplanes sp. NBRC 14428]|nr:hypothetical protein Asp14428_22140 [Actinoplanes sp. NBRC 14428]
MRAAVVAALALALPAVFTPAAAHAGYAGPNAVVTWNTYAQDAIYEVARQPPYVTARSFAMVQGRSTTRSTRWRARRTSRT